jgi:hypothetical protein
MAKRSSDKSEQQKNLTSTNNVPDHLAAGAAELRSRAKSCRITSGNVSACRRLEAAAELLSPEAVEPAEEAAEGAAEALASGKGRGKAKGRKSRGPAPEVTADVEDDDELGDVDDDADDDADDEEA